MTQARLLRVMEVAAILGTSRWQTYNLLKKGIVPSVRLGRAIRVDSKQLEKFIANGGARKPKHRRKR